MVAAFVQRIIAETEHQNLIAASTVGSIWVRHVIDSAQLVPLADTAGTGCWLDIGSGAGFPGMVSAILTDRETVLVEPRAKRAALLQSIASDLGLSKVVVHQSRMERVALTMPAAIVTARAVAALDTLFAMAHRQTTPDTLWILPKGRGAADEIELARRNWKGTFHVEHSLTDPTSSIVVARGVTPK